MISGCINVNPKLGSVLANGVAFIPKAPPIKVIYVLYFLKTPGVYSIILHRYAPRFINIWYITDTSSVCGFKTRSYQVYC